MRHLHLHFADFDTANDLFDILCACPKLSSLCLSHVHCDNSENPPVFNVVSLQPVVLKELSLENTQSEIMTWLTHSPFQLSLQSLQALWDDSSDESCLASVEHVLKTVGTSLQNIKLGVTVWRSQIDLSWNEQLSNLHLQIRMGSVRALEVDAIFHLKFRHRCDHDMLSSTYESISSALASVCSRQLHDIDFVFEFHKGGDLSALDWEKIDEHLERLARMRAFPEQLQVLFRLNFVNQDETAESYSADTIKRRLPRLLTSSAKVDITTVTAGWLESSSIHPWRY
ncbi:uncharacterized protein LAESUDRAFT_345801 [Laetiporus sulphureus 93-53]|uniref:F-box domain-containing protein n=1 Tax=Laetiporus sulphureus 93-53 TaxID=1314785 RepID=A0A165GRD1_9APHY|nr:uncharacterized protein LAESUDRAFT_345801 [Laetiporus sulphureus 93-53]KZT10700.1 hypothetical protein LAESUDRAFT_345801 [Laetiporus sulphureus 93-53]